MGWVDIDTMTDVEPILITSRSVSKSTALKGHWVRGHMENGVLVFEPPPVMRIYQNPAQAHFDPYYQS